MYCLTLWTKEEKCNCEIHYLDPQIHRDLRTTVCLFTRSLCHCVYTPAAVTEDKTCHPILRRSLPRPSKLTLFQPGRPSPSSPGPHRSSPRASRKCPTMLGKFVWQVSDPTLIIHCQPQASTVQKNTSHHAQKGFSYASLFLAVPSTGVEREWDVTIYISPSAGIHTRHIVIVNTCVTM